MSESANVVPGVVATPREMPYASSSRGFHDRSGTARIRLSMSGAYEASPLVESQSCSRVVVSAPAIPVT